jgi:hypothetical protein
MKIKFTFLVRDHEEIRDIDAYVAYAQTEVIPKILDIDGVDHVELCHFVPFSFIEPKPTTEQVEQKHVLQMDIYYDEEAGIEQAMANFDNAYLVEEIIRQDKYLDLYISYITTFKKENFL